VHGGDMLVLRQRAEAAPDGLRRMKGMSGTTIS
jgi:hypothetical protein